mgnify:CR=1 FL=1
MPREDKTMEKLKFRVADYGAVGDGVTDDGPAISRGGRGKSGGV